MIELTGLENAMRSRGLSGLALAHRSGISQATISRARSGAAAPPTPPEEAEGLTLRVEVQLSEQTLRSALEPIVEALVEAVERAAERKRGGDEC